MNAISPILQRSCGQSIPAHWTMTPDQIAKACGAPGPAWRLNPRVVAIYDAEQRRLTDLYLAYHQVDFGRETDQIAADIGEPLWVPDEAHPDCTREGRA